MLFSFQSKGYATQAHARRILERHADMFADCNAFVAVQGDRLYPVLIFREGRALPLHALAARGITIIN